MQNLRDGAQIVVFGNNADGAGKTLAAACAAVALLYDGCRVGTVDLDEDSRDLTRFWDRRRDRDPALPQPLHFPLAAGGRDERALQNALTVALTELAMDCDVIIVDTPRADRPLARLAHGYADTLVTPLQEGDLRSLALFKNRPVRIEKPTAYAEMIEDQNIRKLDRDARPIYWLGLRSRILPSVMKKKRQTADIFDKLSDHLGFVPLTALHERPVYKDLFDKGLTISDPGHAPDMSALVARQEVRTLVHAIRPPGDAGARAHAGG